MRDKLPTGTVTFLFTDVEGSTRLLHSLGAEAYAEVLAEHRRVIREACAPEGGVEVDTQGDAFFFAFPTAPGALAAAAALTESLAPGPIHVRIGLHTGAPLVTEEAYVGADVHRAARIAGVAHGGQVLVSASSARLVELELKDLGEHRLKDLSAPERIYQFGDGDFPALKSLYRTNLPIPATPFLGREAELAEVVELLSEAELRLLTLTGPGGTGKTRLALQAAGLASDGYPDGVWWIPLAPLRDPSLVVGTAAQTLGSKNGLAEHIADKRMLCLFDNFEQVVMAARDLSSLVSACPNLDVLVTSRERLRVSREQTYPVPPLAESDGEALFVTRARAVDPAFVSSDAARELCVRLDELPLALELAAARTAIFSPEQLLEKLGERLDLLKGERDADPRQQTLRTTIEWSHDLLSENEKRLFRELAVFAGGCTYDAAEEVAAADPDTLQSLLDKSLVRKRDSPVGHRYWMLETIREYARERLEEAGDLDESTGRHTRYYLGRVEDEWQRDMMPGAEAQAWFGAELDNLRCMLDRLAEAASSEAAKAAKMLFRFWKVRGAYAEAHQRLESLLAVGDLTEDERADLLGRLAELRERLGDLDGAETAAAEALTLASPGTPARVVGLLVTSSSEVLRGNLDEGIRLGRLAVEESRGLDAWTRAGALGDLGLVLVTAGKRDEARVVTAQSIEEARRSGETVAEAWGRGQLGYIDLLEGDYEPARRALADAVSLARREGVHGFLVGVLQALGYAYLGLEQRGNARATFADAFELAVGQGPPNPELASAGCGLALSVEPAEHPEGARLRGAIARFRQDFDLRTSSSREYEELEHRFEQPMIDALGVEAYETARARGFEMNLEQMIELARSVARS